MKQIVIIGGGMVAERIIKQLNELDYTVTRVGSRDLLQGDDMIPLCDLAVIASVDFAADAIMKRMAPSQRVLDLGPTFRIDQRWVYGLPELPYVYERVREAQYVANPGCFAQSAILPIGPVYDFFPNEGIIYLDGVGGYTTGGQALIDKHESGTLPVENMMSLLKTHRHIEEIKFALTASCPIMFKPKIVDVPTGIRMCVPLIGERWNILPKLESFYRDTNIQVFHEVPKSIAVDAWAGKEGAGIWVVEDQETVMLVCCLDNLIRGALEPAMLNIKLMIE